ncbi:MAG: DUF1566 domain-containing protein [Nitrospira sp.]|nr:DUF1566 domain-containing protein [Nitrospira sp.]MCP9441868.1 DUF1566 domain-containing protein [Nitrospira sp.]
MTPKWIIAGALVVAVGSLSLLAYLLLSTPAGLPVGKEELMAEIVRSWQEAHPAENRFEILPAFQNDAVLDKETGLIWELAPDSTRVTWNEARASCVRRVIGGQKGWRLPSPAEMRSLVGPAIDAPGPNIPPGHPFLNIVQTSYWTVVPEANLPSYARYLDAFLGNVLSMTRIYTFPVWCVRGPIHSDNPR